MNINILKFSSDSEARFGVKMSLTMEKRRSTAALEGIAVLYFINRLMNICSPRNAAPLTVI